MKDFHVISNDEYHADKTTVGHSALVRLLRSPAHYAEYLYLEFKITPALSFGREVHPAIQDKTGNAFTHPSSF